MKEKKERENKAILLEAFYQKAAHEDDREFQKLLEKDEIPSIWKNYVQRLSILCSSYAAICDRARKTRRRKFNLMPDDLKANRKLCESFMALGKFGLYYLKELDDIDWYIESAKKKLIRHQRLGRTFKELIHTAIEGQPHLKEKALLVLISMDPRWLYEDWVQNRIAEAARQDDRNFFKQLGQAIADEKQKVFAPAPRNKKTLHLVTELKSSVFAKALFPYKMKRGDVRRLLDELIRKGSIDPDVKDFTPKTFRTFLQRHNLLPRVSKKLLA